MRRPAPGAARWRTAKPSNAEQARAPVSLEEVGRAGLRRDRRALPARSPTRTRPPRLVETPNDRLKCREPTRTETRPASTPRLALAVPRSSLRARSHVTSRIVPLPTGSMKPSSASRLRTRRTISVILQRDDERLGQVDVDHT